MDISSLSIELLVLLFGAGMVAGFVDSIAGGGGLIALPVLLFIGLPPQAALGTLKLQGSFGTFSAAYHFISKGYISFRQAAPGVVFTLIGASGGSLLVQKLDPQFIKPLITLLLALVFIYMLLNVHLGRYEQAPRMGRWPYYGVFGLSLGFYDGFFGPGTGSFWTFSLLLLVGYDMIKAVGYTKVMNVTSNIVALIWFILGGNVVYSIGLVMAIGQLIGARLGSGLAMSRGVGIIRPIYLAVVFVTIVRLLAMNFFPSS
jgi:uncharacterized protein